MRDGQGLSDREACLRARGRLRRSSEAVAPFQTNLTTSPLITMAWCVPDAAEQSQIVMITSSSRRAVISKSYQMKARHHDEVMKRIFRSFLDSERLEDTLKESPSILCSSLRMNSTQ